MSVVRVLRMVARNRDLLRVELAYANFTSPNGAAGSRCSCTRTRTAGSRRRASSRPRMLVPAAACAPRLAAFAERHPPGRVLLGRICRTGDDLRGSGGLDVRRRPGAAHLCAPRPAGDRVHDDAPDAGHLRAGHRAAYGGVGGDERRLRLDREREHVRRPTARRRRPHGRLARQPSSRCAPRSARAGALLVGPARNAVAALMQSKNGATAEASSFGGSLAFVRGEPNARTSDPAARVASGGAGSARRPLCRARPGSAPPRRELGGIPQRGVRPRLGARDRRDGPPRRAIRGSPCRSCSRSAAGHSRSSASAPRRGSRSRSRCSRGRRRALDLRRDGEDSAPAGRSAGFARACLRAPRGARDGRACGRVAARHRARTRSVASVRRSSGSERSFRSPPSPEVAACSTSTATRPPPWSRCRCCGRRRSCRCCPRRRSRPWRELSSRRTCRPERTSSRRASEGDRYYVIADGDVDVIVDGALSATLHRGDGFGEIALTHDVPRTATVRTRSATQLYAVEQDDFLAALSQHAPTRAHAHGLASERLEELERLRAQRASAPAG